MEVLTQIEQVLAAGRNLVLVAPPGAGKTTEVPPALLRAPWCTGQVIVTEPRRIAARLAATRVAQKRKTPLGAEVGYRVRFDDRTSPKTRIVFETEGLLLRRLAADRSLAGVSAVLVDEVHERSQNVDALLAILGAWRRGHPELRLGVMSATIDAQDLARALDAEIVETSGRAYPVEVRHEDRPDDRPLPIRVRSALQELRGLSGDALVFLPGAREIRACQDALEPRAELEVLPLHGDMPLEAQARVLGGASRGNRVILSTNIAESSVTIPGVTKVIDSGQSRVARHDPFSGAMRLEVEPVSQARCVQRAGRAGRIAEGHCLRLFSRGNFAARPVQDTPELLRADLSELLLLLLESGLDWRELAWPTPAPESSWQAAERLLTGLGAIAQGKLTDLGRRMAQLPLPPRLARIACEGHRLGNSVANRAVALLSERDISRRTTFGPGRARNVTLSHSDLDDRLAWLEAWEAGARRGGTGTSEIDSAAARNVLKIEAQLERIMGSWPREAQTPACDDPEELLARCVFTGFFDRVASRRPPSPRLTLSTGARAELSESSAVQTATLLLGVSAAAGRSRQGCLSVDLAVQLDPDWLFAWAEGEISVRETASYDPARDCVDLKSQLVYGKVVLDESSSVAKPGELACEPLLRAALSKGPSVYDPKARLESLSVRLELLSAAPRHLLARLCPAELKLLDTAADLEALRQEALRIACCQVASIGALSELDLTTLLLFDRGTELLPLLDRELPESVVLPGGRRLLITYQVGKSPFAESRLQDFFSLLDTPRLLAGSLPLQLHLLAPNKRAVQVTTDLAGFWERHYPELRRALMRRYPKHSWPLDGRTAAPPPPGRLK